MSEQGGKGHRSDYIETIPEYLEIPEKYGVEIDIMIEAKQKNKLSFDSIKNINLQIVRSK